MKILKNPILLKLLNKDLQSELELFKKQQIDKHVQRELTDRKRNSDVFSPSLTWIGLLVAIGFLLGSFLSRDGVLIGFVLLTMVPISLGSFMFGPLGLTFGLLIAVFGISAYFLLASYLPSDTHFITVLLGSGIGSAFAFLLAIISDRFVRQNQIQDEENCLIKEISARFSNYQLRPSECLEFLDSRVSNFVQTSRYELLHKKQSYQELEDKSKKIIDELGTSLDSNSIRVRTNNTKELEKAREFLRQSDSMIQFLDQYQSRLDSLIVKLRTIMKEEQKVERKRLDYELNKKRASELIAYELEFSDSWLEERENLKDELGVLINDFNLMINQANINLNPEPQEKLH